MGQNLQKKEHLGCRYMMAYDISILQQDVTSVQSSQVTPTEPIFIQATSHRAEV